MWLLWFPHLPHPRAHLASYHDNAWRPRCSTFTGATWRRDGTNDGRLVTLPSWRGNDGGVLVELDHATEVPDGIPVCQRCLRRYLAADELLSELRERNGPAW